MTQAADANRRDVLATAAATLLIGTLGSSEAWAGGKPSDLDAWARSLAGLNDEVHAGRISVAQWQAKVARLNTSVPLNELTRYLDVDQVTRRFRYPSRLADHADPVLPARVLGGQGMPGWFIRVFGMRQGGAVIPHVHNGMVSAHLVLSGGFHARTHDRVKDLANAVVLKPSIDRALRPGEVITMSDVRDNAHWLEALHDRSMTFDVGVVDTRPSWPYGLKANDYHMIFVDAGAKPEGDGTVIAKTMSFDQCAAKYAG
ncbi:MAG TPA: hypothetical protein VG407_04540 [Caulobacteraceae bacterium]|jgi:hypothetical protein|nr:hypothetical protein [Caulobacteraceae bacterium]